MNDIETLTKDLDDARWLLVQIARTCGWSCDSTERDADAIMHAAFEATSEEPEA